MASFPGKIHVLRPTAVEPLDSTGGLHDGKKASDASVLKHSHIQHHI